MNNKRILSIDILRGLAIAIMLMGNMEPDLDRCFLQLQHADWEGVHLLDFAFPSFLFIMGCSAPFSRISDGLAYSVWFKKILRRAVLLFLLGLLCNNFFPIMAMIFVADFSWSDLFRATITEGRFIGVLQRLAMGYFFGMVLIRFIKQQRNIFILSFLLLMFSSLGYHAYGMEQNLTGPFLPENNISSYIDMVTIGVAHTYQHAKFDPEGLFGLINSISTFLFGWLCGSYLIIYAQGFTDRSIPVESKKFGLVYPQLFLWGCSFLLLSWCWSLWDIVSKPLWTSPYVLLMAGSDTLLIFLLENIIHYSNHHRVGHLFVKVLQPLECIGKNPILVYLGSELLLAALWTALNAEMPVYIWLWQNTLQNILFLQDYVALSAAIYSFVWLALLTIICEILQKRGIVIKL